MLGCTEPSAPIEWPFRVVPCPFGLVESIFKRRIVAGWYAFQCIGGNSPTPEYRGTSNLGLVHEALVFCGAGEGGYRPSWNQIEISITYMFASLP
jgi:hypothetical protein